MKTLTFTDEEIDPCAFEFFGKIGKLPASEKKAQE